MVGLTYKHPRSLWTPTHNAIMSEVTGYGAEGDYPKYFTLPLIPDGESEAKVAETIMRGPISEVKIGDYILDGERRMVELKIGEKTIYHEYTWGYAIHLAYVGDAKNYQGVASAQISYILESLPNMTYTRYGDVFYVYDINLNIRPFLIYQTSITEICRTSSPFERIFINRDESGNDSVYVTATYVQSITAVPEEIVYDYYWNPRETIDRPFLYEPVSNFYSALGFNVKNYIMGGEDGALISEGKDGKYVLVDGWNDRSWDTWKVSPFFAETDITMATKYMWIIDGAYHIAGLSRRLRIVLWKDAK